jgi:nitrite reductase/ring-hydroxylating ferredoxin subunit
MHALVSLTPEGAYRTRVYVTMAIDPETFPTWMERAFRIVSPNKALCDVLAGIMANFIKNEFDIDAIIWANRKHLHEPALLPSEEHLREVIRWGESFYPKDFKRTAEPPKSEEDKRWETLDALKNIIPGTLHRYTVANEELVARTDATGRLRVFDAFCPHQGAHLGHGVRIDDDCLRCPFHGLYFDTDGRWIGSNLKNRDKFIKSLNLTAVKHRVRDGQVEVLV